MFHVCFIRPLKHTGVFITFAVVRRKSDCWYDFRHVKKLKILLGNMWQLTWGHHCIVNVILHESIILIFGEHIVAKNQYYQKIFVFYIQLKILSIFFNLIIDKTKIIRSLIITHFCQFCKYFRMKLKWMCWELI